MNFHRGVFDLIVGFTQLDFYPHIAAPFLQKLAVKVFIEGYDVEFIVGNLLVEEQNLGRNTGVAVMTATRGWRFFLCSQSLARPLGIPISPQCSSCGRLQCSKWKTLPTDMFTVQVTCKCCDHVYERQPNDNDHFTKLILKGVDGWGIGVYWGPAINFFLNGAEAFAPGKDTVTKKGIQGKEQNKE